MIHIRRLFMLTLLFLSGCSDPTQFMVVGTLERDRIQLSAELGEPVTAIHVREGQQVTVGETLIEQDNERVNAELARLTAAADRVRRRLDELVRGPRQEAIDEARGHLSAAEAELQTARQDVQRIAPLEQQNLASREQLERARNAREQAAGQVAAARAALAALLAGTTVEQLEQARAAVREAEAAVTRQQLTVKRLVQTAPRAARVEALPFELGERPPAGAALVILQATDQAPYARVYVPAALHHQLQAGDKVRVNVDGHGEREGEVRFVAGEASYTPYFALTEHDAERLSYLVEIDLNDASELPSGIPVRMVVLPGSAETSNE
ncbi:HlyD family efflux transporter periplasmic adaptor subunit [Pseudidiomarina sp. 1APP75-27a]|uniref:HlyD family secretion protein n=1 Tax=Pseudidiomarina terrestris TaxID=2820060 RepID=UPI002B05192E|nr:HlyD family efflux transporter periplasmic adaptor subunit [Pseudidiomarina sp. 1APP75-27a]MEA3587926.1 HlyD family efflux transporter periplasmic adaptor subunit [Pseudidiomarina sp. 1APP75-27a]